MNTSAEAIERFHRYLPTIRKAFGFSANDLANLLEVSIMTIRNIENPQKKMSKIHYLAIRTILVEETKKIQNPDYGEMYNKNARKRNEYAIKDLFHILVDINDISEEERQGVANEISSLIKNRNRITNRNDVEHRIREVYFIASHFLEDRHIKYIQSKSE